MTFANEIFKLVFILKVAFSFLGGQLLSCPGGSARYGRDYGHMGRSPGAHVYVTKCHVRNIPVRGYPKLKSFAGLGRESVIVRLKMAKRLFCGDAELLSR